MAGIEDQKLAAAEAAAALVEEGMRVGLGTGTTAALFVASLAARDLREVRCVPTSPATEAAARGLGLRVEPFDSLDALDLAVDGADQVAPDRWTLKGRGGAHTREKVVAAAAERFVVIVSSDKPVERLGPPVPAEVLRFGLAATLRRLSALGSPAVREAPPTPDGNVLVDVDADVADPARLAGALEAIPGVVGHGLFSPQLVTTVLVGLPDGSVERRGL